MATLLHISVDFSGRRLWRLSFLSCHRIHTYLAHNDLIRKTLDLPGSFWLEPENTSVHKRCECPCALLIDHLAVEESRDAAHRAALLELERKAMSDQDACSSTRSADRPWNLRLVESEKLWTYQWGGHIYFLLLKRGKYYVKFSQEESWKPVDMPSSDRWLYRDGSWINLASATHYNYLGLWKDFAFRILPHMDYLIRSGNLSSREIKDLSYAGCTKKYGDVGNQVYSLVVDVAVALRTTYGHVGLHEVEGRGAVKRGDILEYVMGTRTAGADPAWLAAAEVVDGLCVFVYEFWNSNLCRDVYDQRTMCHKISEACCLLDDWLETQVGAQKASFRCIDLALRSSVGKRLVGVIHEFIIDPIAPHATTLSRYGASGSRSLATVHDT